MLTEPSHIFISYAHADEAKWLSFVTGYLRPAVKQGAVEIWIATLMRGGDPWDKEIERKLRECDIFILLVSRHSLSSDYVLDKEIAIIRERQARGEDVHFYPLVLTPTPKIALDLVRDKNLRPPGGKPLSDYSRSQRDQQMSQVADEIAAIAEEIAKRAIRPPPTVSPHTKPSEKESWREINDRDSLEDWFARQSGQVALAIAARCVLRVATLAVQVPLKRHAVTISDQAKAVFQAGALARILAKYPQKADELRPATNAARGVAADAALAAAKAGDAAGNAAFAAARHAVSGANALAAAPNRVGQACASAAASAAAATTFAAEKAADAAPADTAWREIRADVAALQELDSGHLADSPLWSLGAPRWAKTASNRLQSALPPGEDWEVWIDWYEDCLQGRSRGEAYELVFASVPMEIWEPAAANSWIKGHLPKDA